MASTIAASKINAELQELEADARRLDTDLEQIQPRIDEREADLDDGREAETTDTGNRRLPAESQRDFLIRTGKITPFSQMPGRKAVQREVSLQGALLDAEAGDEDDEDDVEEANFSTVPAGGSLSHQNLRRPGFADVESTVEANADNEEPSERPAKRRRLEMGNLGHDVEEQKQPKRGFNRAHEVETASKEGGVLASSSMQGLDEHASNHTSDDMSEFEASDRSDSRSVMGDSPAPERTDTASAVGTTGVDDGNEKLYQKRLQSWASRRANARSNAQRAAGKPDVKIEDTEESALRADSEQVDGDVEWTLPHPTISDTEIEGGLKIPGDVYPSLFDYQKTGVRWLWELFSQQVGGIVGDEMGLGKTIQVIAFLAALHHSRKLSKPVLIVAPATVMKQWVNEFHTWWPPFRVSILHSSGSGMVDMGKEAEDEDDLLSLPVGSMSIQGPSASAKSAARKVLNRVKKDGHILVTTYSGLQNYAELLIPTEWQYAVLDEGHKIRNPNIGITIYCKELRTPNRIILSGTPMQNNLVELWSLFDFIFPMRLGTLVNFRQQFDFPIRQGGYANASNLQVQTALKCAEALKEAISPYLLQRFKADVAADLPKKSEQVLFCKLTKPQRDAYESFLSSNELQAIMAGKRQVLYGIDILRKICNHPDLQDHRGLSIKAGYNYGSGNKSGKMQVVKALLELWRDQGHRTLLFAQHKIMLDILEKFIKSLSGFSYRRMDGTTPIHARQGMVDEFNGNPNAHVFLLTTKVGGLGINLTGADRVIIYDPDWNPSTDIQARERAWRLGQKREVMIYRLMTSGTIEEKIYHRQLFKQFLINKILRDPKQRQTFQLKDLHDLFTLGGADDTTTETGGLFEGAEKAVKNIRSDDNSNILAASELDRQHGDGGDALKETASVRNMTGVSSLEQFQAGEEENKPTADNGINSEARMMENIFARSGVHATFEHDQIVNGRKIISADPQIIEQEARRIAAEAARGLKRAGELAKNVPIGTPTWTGQYGTAGRPVERPRAIHAGPGRSNGGLNGLLGRLNNNSASSSMVNPSSEPAGQASSAARGTDFLKLIRDYLIAHGGQVHTQMLIDHFNRHCTTERKTAEFKAMLREIATLQKGSRGRGKWSLKDEYRTRGQ